MRNITIEKRISATEQRIEVLKLRLKTEKKILKGLKAMVKQRDLLFTFGKYNGVLVADVPNSYLNWVLEQDWFCKEYVDLKNQVEIELVYRNKFNVEV